MTAEVLPRMFRTTPPDAREDPLAWQADALCAQTDPELFTPEKKGDGNSRAAKKICARCEMRAQCLAYALATGQAGTWGGTTERERRKMRRNAA